MEDKIIEVLEKYEVSNWDMQQMTIELLNLLDVSYSVFDHVTIERIRKMKKRINSICVNNILSKAGSVNMSHNFFCNNFMTIFI